ncbi:MAG: hypothetical protein ABEH77_07490 [Halobacteriaceae archaeon]
MSSGNANAAAAGRDDDTVGFVDRLREYVAEARWFGYLVLVELVLVVLAYGIDTLAGESTPKTEIAHATAGLLGAIAVILAVAVVIAFVVSLALLLAASR